MNKKLIWGIVIVAVVIIVGVLVIPNRYGRQFTSWMKYHNDPNYGKTGPVDYSDIKTDNNPVASNLKTYSSTKYGVSFTYPSDWTVKEPNNTEGDALEIISPETAAWVKAHPNATAVEGISYDMYIGIHGYKQVGYEGTGPQVKFNGVDALFINNDRIDHPSVTYIVDKSPRTYVISAFQPLTETKNTILSSIKFTN